MVAAEPDQTNSAKRPAPGGLQDLIARRKKELGLSYSQLVERTEAAGYPIRRTMWHHWASDRWSDIPATEVIHGIAAGLGVDPDEVLDAAAKSVGITPRELHLGRGTRAILALMESRTPEEIEALEAVVRSVTKAMDATRD
jgi:transcriptional regulator with XRE-family HTH domain